MPKKEVKKDGRHKNLREFLIQESETRGSITKQIKRERGRRDGGGAINNFVT